MRKTAILPIITLALLVGSLAPAAAIPLGPLNLTNGLGGGAIFTGTFIDWVVPVGPPNGSLTTGLGTNVTLTGAALGPGVLGSVLDVSLLGSPVLPNFMTFAAVPTLVFDLTSIGPGVGSASCAGLSMGQSCSPSVASPYILTATSTGTTLSLTAGGIARDVLDGPNTWSGAFTSQFSLTPAQLQAALLAGSPLVNTYSGTFTVGAQSVPEPSAGALLLIGGATLAARRWVRRRKSL